MEAETTTNNHRKYHPLSNCISADSDSNDSETKKTTRPKLVASDSRRSGLSVATLATRFGPKGSMPKDNNYDSAYFEQFSWRDSEYYDFRVRWLQLKSCARSQSHRLATSLKRNSKAVEVASTNSQLDLFRRRTKVVCAKFGRKVKDIWINGLAPTPQRTDLEDLRRALKQSGNQFGMCRGSALVVQDEVYQCLGDIESIWDDSMQMDTAERIIQSLPRMIELRMLIQYEFLEPLRPCTQRSSVPLREGEAGDGRSSPVTPAISSSSAQRSSATSNGVTLVGSYTSRSTICSYGPIPTFPYDNTPAPNPAVEALLHKLLEQDWESGLAIETNQRSPASTRRGLPLMASMECAATILRLKKLDIIAELEFYVSILSGSSSSCINPRDCLIPERRLDERRRSVQRDLGLVLGKADRYDQRRISWINKKIWQEKQRLQDLAMSSPFEFGVTIVDGRENVDEPSKAGYKMRGALWMKRRHSAPSSIVHSLANSGEFSGAIEPSRKLQGVHRRSSFCGFEKISL